jgi:glycosyltransferase involved in cell wall biosynthesis
MGASSQPSPAAQRAGPTTPTISVVMPVHNGERFLQEAIDSILGQTAVDLELIVVDDGSTDGTPAILAQAPIRDPRVRVCRLDRNQGIAGALNEGCRLARGAFIARMDADDVSLPTRLETQLRYLRLHPDVAVVGSWVRRIDQHGSLGAVQRYPSEPPLVAWSMMFFNSIAHPTVVMRREALHMDAVYKAEYPPAEDYAFFAGLSRTHRLANVPEVLLHYRLWSGNSSRSPEMDRQATRIVRDHAGALGVRVTEAESRGLQGLARDRYPAMPDESRALADRIVELRSAVVRQLPVSDGAVAIDRDAAVRLWLLAAVSARRSPLAAVSLAARAVRLSPGSLVTFLGKIAGRVSARGR